MAFFWAAVTVCGKGLKLQVWPQHVLVKWTARRLEAAVCPLLCDVVYAVVVCLYCLFFSDPPAGDFVCGMHPGHCFVRLRGGGGGCMFPEV